jgi:hypothetical protein
LRVIFIGTKQPVHVAASVLALAGLCSLALVAWQIPVACAPIVVYGLIGFQQRDHFESDLAEQDNSEPAKQHAASLTLAGFCFTSLSLLVSFFNEAIQHEDSAPENMILFFLLRTLLFCSLLVGLEAQCSAHIRIPLRSLHRQRILVHPGRLACIFLRVGRHAEARHRHVRAAGSLCGEFDS